VATGPALSVRARFSRHRLPILALAAAAATAAVVVPAGVGSAAPTLTLAQVESQVSSLNAQVERIAETYNTADTQLGALKRKQRITDRELTRDQRALDTAQARVAAGAAAAYRGGTMSPALALISSGSPAQVLNQSSSLDEVAHVQADQVATANSAQRVVAAAQAVHDAEVSQQRQVLGSISSKRSQIEGLLAKEKALLSHLQAAQRARLAAAQHAAQQHAVAERSSYHPPTATYNGPATGQASAAIQYAYAQLGKPYQWGGAGPDSFDCSGLVMRAWGAGGVGLPHSAAGDQAMLPSVSLSAMQPGDLVFYGSPAYHVALYIGGGQIIQAPHTGADVEISSVGSATSAGRP
jgi:peptidoglycan DL-endopeptidase CwlO